MEIRKGSWVVITTKSNPKVQNLDGSAGKMASLDGKTLKLPGSDGSNFEMIEGNGCWFWDSNQGHFRLAKSKEIQKVLQPIEVLQPNLNQEPQYEIY